MGCAVLVSNKVASRRQPFKPQSHFPIALNHPHLHIVVLDGMYQPVGEGVRFHRVTVPSHTQLQTLFAGLIARVLLGVCSPDRSAIRIDVTARTAMADCVVITS